MLSDESYLSFLIFGNIEEPVPENKNLNVTKIGIMLLHDLVQGDTVYPMALSFIHRFQYFLFKHSHVLLLP